MTPAQERRYRELERRLEVGINGARLRLLDPSLSARGRVAAVEELLELRLARAGVDGGARQAHYLRMHGVARGRPVLRRPGGTVRVR